MLEKIVKPLLAWYDKGKRILPWRQSPTPYHVWVSEIMLQQTRVEAVKPYYDRFMQELPDIQALAETDEEKLLKLWEGLGYYNRARNLKKAADKIVIEYDGRMPDSYEELIKLPGIGSYTAGAIASIAFGRPHPAVDGNVLRILARLRLDERDILDAGVKRAVEAEILQIMPGDRPGDFNQALMELGAVVCIPNGTAKCGICPLAAFCEASRTERVAEFPKKSLKKQRSVEEKTVLVIRKDDKVALRKRKDKGLLAGMYEFPSMDGTQTAGRVLAHIKSMGMMPLKIEKLTTAKHIFTHKEWHMTGFSVRIDELEKKEPTDELFFATLQELEERYPVPSAFSAYMKFLGTQERSV
ncbi:MAG: A/G-specific adenine glycosylase [Clostridium sp.]|nr:A/G-specific adenine glycosylase [Clostridium sp.]